VATPALDWPELREYRDWMVRHLDDAGQVGGYEHAGATVIKGAARLVGPARVEADGELLEADHVVIATGSEPVRPDIDGLDGIEVWTNREATTTADIPGRVLLVGGGAVGVGFGQFYAGMGAQVTIVQRAATLIDREDPRVGELAVTRWPARVSPSTPGVPWPGPGPRARGTAARLPGGAGAVIIVEMGPARRRPPGGVCWSWRGS